MKHQLGAIVIHIISGQQMVVISADVFKDSDINDKYKCRYFNEKTGEYKVETFYPIELYALGR